MANWYCSSVAHTAVAQFAISHAYTLGNLIRSLATPTVGQERVFRCTTAGTSGGSESAWNITKGALTTQGGAVFTEVTGQESFQGTTWAAPFARLQSAVASGWPAAGDTIFVGSDHAETQAASMTCSGIGTLTAPLKLLCVTRTSNALPPASTDLTTGGSIATTASNNITMTGSYYAYGLTFSAGNSTGAAVLSLSSTTEYSTWDTCTFSLPGTNASGNQLIFGPAGGNFGGQCKFRNVTVNMGATTHIITVRACSFEWRGGSLTGSALATLFGASYAGSLLSGPLIDVWDVDLSVLAGSSCLVTVTGSVGSGGPTTYNFVNCRLNASLAGVMTGTIQAPEIGNIDLITSDNTGSGSREEHYRYSGSIVADTTNYLTSGASNGVTHKSWKIVANSNANIQTPLNAPDIIQWIGTTGSKTLTLFFSNIAGVTYKDTQIGIEVDYLGNASYPLGSLATSFANPLAAGANLSTDTSGWTGQGGLTKQKVSVTFTVNQIGFVRIRLSMRTSGTVWVDPLAVVV